MTVWQSCYMHESPSIPFVNKGVLLRDNELAASHVKRATHKATQVNRSDGLLRTQLLFLIRVGRERGDGFVCVGGWGRGEGKEGEGGLGAQFSDGRAYLLYREHCTVLPIIRYALRSGI